MDLSEPAAERPPTREQVEQWVQNVGYELRKATERGVNIGPASVVYMPASMIAAAVQLSQQTMRLQYEPSGASVLLCPPPPDYTLGTIEQEIERAHTETAPKELPTMDDGASS